MTAPRAGADFIHSAVITHDSAASLELATGKRICAIFKASSVIIGLTA